jgi:hypothetical protein
MFCPNCGKEVPDGSIFCPECGTKIEKEPTTDVSATTVSSTDNVVSAQPSAATDTNAAAQTQGSSNNNIPNSKLSNKKLSNKTIGIIAAAVVAALVIIFIVTRPPKIKLSKYMDIDVKGYNGYGTATASFDDKAFEKDFKGKIKFTSEGKKEVDDNLGELSDLLGVGKNGNMEMMIIEEAFNGKLSKDSKLSNGDKLTYKWDQKDMDQIEKYFKVRIDSSDVDYTVNDLKKVSKKDVFKDINVKFSGVSPDGEAVIKGAPKGLYFDIDKSSGLSNGDKVVVSVEMGSVESFVEENGYVPKETKKTYKVEGLSSYLTKLSDVSTDSLEKLKKEAQDEITAYVASDYTGSTVEGLTYAGCYLLMSKNSDDLIFGSHTQLYVVFSGNDTATDGSRAPAPIYFPVEFDDAMVDSKGVVSYDDIYGIVGYSSIGGDIFAGSSKGYYDPAEMYKEIVSANVDDYTYEVSEELKQFGQ